MAVDDELESTTPAALVPIEQLDATDEPEAAAEAPDAPEAPSRPVAEAPKASAQEPKAEPGARPADPALLQAQLEQSSQIIAEMQRRQEAAEIHRRDALFEQQLTQQQNQWTEQGYDVNAIQTLAGRERTVHQQTQQLENTRRQLQQDTMAQLQNGQGKIIAAQQYSSKYGIPAASLMKYDTPEMMEQVSKNFQMAAELATIKEKAVSPQEFEQGATQGSVASGSAARLTQLSSKNGHWTETEYAEALKLRG